MYLIGDIIVPSHDYFGDIRLQSLIESYKTNPFLCNFTEKRLTLPPGKRKNIYRIFIRYVHYDFGQLKICVENGTQSLLICLTSNVIMKKLFLSRKNPTHYFYFEPNHCSPPCLKLVLRWFRMPNH